MSEYKKEVERIQNDAKQKISELSKKYAYENAIYKNGDKITYNGDTIIVDDIKWSQDNDNRYKKHT